MAPVLYDVVILGGGPAGCATAIALHTLGIDNILVAEAGNYTRPRIGESIPPDTRGLLSRLGVWQAFEREGHETCLGSYSSWGSDILGFNDFLFNPRGHGWHLDRLRFDRFMADEMVMRGLRLETRLRFRDVRSDRHHYPFSIDFGEHEPVRCRFVVDATGRAAKLARRLGARRSVEDKLVCVAAYYRVGDSDDAPALKRLTLLEAVEIGWWYSARLPGNRIIAAIASDADIIQQRQLQQPGHWYGALAQTQHLAGALVSHPIPKRLHTWVAPSALLDPPAGAGWLAVGDAASAYDPISSQGIYKALQQGLNAAPAIVDWLNGDNQALVHYRQTVGEEFIDYLEQRAYFYDLEQRWPKAEFWQNRQRGSTKDDSVDRVSGLPAQPMQSSIAAVY